MNAIDRLTGWPVHYAECGYDATGTCKCSAGDDVGELLRQVHQLAQTARESREMLAEAFGPDGDDD